MRPEKLKTFSKTRMDLTRKNIILTPMFKNVNH